MPGRQFGRSVWGPVALGVLMAALLGPSAFVPSRPGSSPAAGELSGQAVPSFSFAAGGDFGAGDGAKANLEALAGMGTSFFLALGDFSYSQTPTEEAWCSFVKERVGASYPFQLVVGDHEDDDGPDGDIDRFAACLPNRMAGMSGTYAKEYFFDYPPQAPLVRSIMISPGITLDGGTYRYRPGNDHWDWIVAAIDGARAAGIPWVVVGAHKPCLSMGIIGSCELGSDLFNLLLAKRVDLVLQGHDHTYQRGKQLANGTASCPELDPGSFDAGCIADDGADGSYTKGAGLVHVLVGTAGKNLFALDTNDPQARYFAKWQGSNSNARHGFLRFDVSPAQLTAQFVSGRSGGFTDTFTLTGGGVGVATSPAAVSFGEQPASSSGPARTVTVTNTTGSPLAVTTAVAGAHAGDFRTVADGCNGRTLPAGGACTVDVAFVPTATGPRTAQLVVGNPVGPSVVGLAGTGTQSPVSFTPSRVDFGSEPVGSRSAPRTVTLRNGTSSPIRLGTPALTGVAAGDFTVSGCAGVTVPAGATCVLTVGFAPSATGVRTAAVEIRSDRATHALAVSGTGGGAGGGYWMVARDGGVFAFGDAAFKGSTGAIRLASPIVGMTPTPTGEGYWMVAADGGIFAFGDAGFHGSTGDIRLVQPIVGMAPTPSGDGYWLLARDGGIFAFGDAGFFGSTGGTRLAQPIVAMTPTPSGQGYWLVAADGGIFAFGDAAFHGSTGEIPLARPIVTMAATPSGNGYWLVASDGGIFAFGDAAFHGSTGDIRLVQPIVGMSATPSGGGYWLVASDGGIFAFGDAAFHGSTGAIRLNQPIVGLAVRP